jgi:hypothetical protein
MSKERLKMMVSGIFYSKLMYCLPVFGNVHGLAIYRDTRGRSAGMTMNDCIKLQSKSCRIAWTDWSPGQAWSHHSRPAEWHQQLVNTADGGELHTHHGPQDHDNREACIPGKKIETGKWRWERTTRVGRTNNRNITVWAGTWEKRCQSPSSRKEPKSGWEARNQW